jgi:hydrogenase small subunit
MDILSLMNPEMTRRDFAKIAGMTAAFFGLSQALTPKMVEALEQAAPKPPVIWLDGQACTGCAESLLNNLEPTASSLLLDTISFRYNETVMAASGYQAEAIKASTIAAGGYVLCIDGSIPMAKDGRFCSIGGKTFRDSVREAARNAAVIICVGACASFGGIPRANVNTDSVGYLFKGKTLHHLFDDVGAKPVINLPTCPLHNERLVATIVYYLTFKAAPPMDSFNRPLAFYGRLQHDNCMRRGNFDARRFVTDFNNPDQQGYCLILKGCKGPLTYQDCQTRLWNNRVSYCINSSFPCAGCAQPEFYDDFSPIYLHDFNFGA